VVWKSKRLNFDTYRVHFKDLNKLGTIVLFNNSDVEILNLMNANYNNALS
jgi:hypothetical protein